MYLRLLKLGDGVFDYYTENVNGNENTSQDLAQRKLTRNVLLAKKISTRKNKTLYRYGNLEILVVKNTIVWIKNSKRSVQVEEDKLRKEILNELLGITKPKGDQSWLKRTVTNLVKKFKR